MVLDVLLKQGVPVAYNRSHIMARVLTRRDPIGRALAVSETTAALEIEHVTCTAEGAPVEHSVDTFLPHSIDLHVVRWLEDRAARAGDRAPLARIDQFDQSGYSRAALGPRWIRTPNDTRRVRMTDRHEGSVAVDSHAPLSFGGTVKTVLETPQDDACPRRRSRRPATSPAGASGSRRSRAGSRARASSTSSSSRSRSPAA